MTWRMQDRDTDLPIGIDIRVPKVRDESKSRRRHGKVCSASVNDFGTKKKRRDGTVREGHRHLEDTTGAVDLGVSKEIYIRMGFK